MNQWVHLIHNWRTGGSSLTALLSVNFHDSYLKVGHPFTRHGWPVDYDKHPLQITTSDQLTQWIKAQSTPAILAGHTYAGMASGLGLNKFDCWSTFRDPAARMNSGLLRFHRVSLKSDHPDGGYVGDSKGHLFESSSEVRHVINTKLSHEINGMCRRLAGYSLLQSGSTVGTDLESCSLLDDRPVDQACFDLAMDRLKSLSWIYLTDQVLPSILLLESHYKLPPLIHPMSDLKHNPQWNGGGITRLQQSLLLKYRPLFEELNSWDVKLYQEATRLFWKRWKVADIDSDRLIARRILQSKPLITGDKIRKGYRECRAQAFGKIEFRANTVKSSTVRDWIRKDAENAQFWNRSLSTA